MALTTRDLIRPLDARPRQPLAVSSAQVGPLTDATVMATTHVTNHLGATYAVLLLALADGRVVSQDARACVLLSPERPADRAWCPECRTRVEVEDASDESTYVGTREVGYYVERLACGHTTQRETGDLGPSPGGESLAEAVAQRDTQARLQRTTEGGWA